MVYFVYIFKKVGVIMEIRFQVFVSSTYEDLKDERKEITQAILESNCFPAGMELFPASNKKQWDVIKRVIDESDIYLVIVAGRYGSTTKDEDGRTISYTEMEFNYAKQQNKPIIALVRDTIDDLPKSKCEHSAKGDKLLKAFRNSVRDGRTIKYWHNPGELKACALISLSNLMKDLSKENETLGWIKVTEVMDKSDSTILRLEKQISEYSQTIQSDKAMIEKNDTDIIDMNNEIKELSYQLQAYKNALNILQNKYYSLDSAMVYDATISCNQFNIVFWKRFADYCSNNYSELFSNESLWKEMIHKEFNKLDSAVVNHNKAEIWSQITLNAKKSAAEFKELRSSDKYQYLANSVVLWESFEPNRDAYATSDDNFIKLFSSLFSLFYISDIEKLDKNIKEIVSAKLFAELEQCIDFSHTLDEIEDCFYENDN